MKLRVFVALIAVLCVAGVASTARADLNHGDYVGTNPGQVDFLQVTENSSTDPLPPQGLFAAPTRVGNSLYFSPSAFASQASDGASDVTEGTLTMTIVADEGMYLGRIALAELGNYMLSGVGTELTSANITGYLQVTGSHGTSTDNLLVVPTPPYQLPEDMFGLWEASAEVDVAAYNLTQVQVTFENVLATTSEVGTTSFVQKMSIEGMAVSIEQIPIIPEPITMSLMGTVALGALLWRRR